MPGYYIRNASGIVPVKDWYVKTLGDSSSTTTHSMTAATAAGGSKGYENGNATIGGAAYGSLSPLSAGGIEVRGLTWGQGAANEPTIVYLGPAGGAASPVPPDDDTTFSRIDITGTFADGTGSRTLLRASADFTGSGSNGTRQWQFRNAKAAKFLSGNTYSATIQRSGSVGPIIKQVKEAYIRTASGIQKYYPAGMVATMLASQESSPANKGFSDGRAGGVMPGSTFSPKTVKSWEVCYIATNNTLNDFYFQLFGATAPPDLDSTFIAVAVTGVFTDSGSPQTKTFTRAGATGYFNAPLSPNFYAFWSWNGPTWKFIVGNTYTVTIT